MIIKSTIVLINGRRTALLAGVRRLAVVIAGGEAGTRECEAAGRPRPGTQGVRAFLRELQI